MVCHINIHSNHIWSDCCNIFNFIFYYTVWFYYVNYGEYILCINFNDFCINILFMWYKYYSMCIKKNTHLMFCGKTVNIYDFGYILFVFIIPVVFTLFLFFVYFYLFSFNFLSRFMFVFCLFLFCSSCCDYHFLFLFPIFFTFSW